MNINTSFAPFILFPSLFMSEFRVFSRFSGLSWLFRSNRRQIENLGVDLDRPSLSPFLEIPTVRSWFYPSSGRFQGLASCRRVLQHHAVQRNFRRTIWAMEN